MLLQPLGNFHQQGFTCMQPQRFLLPRPLEKSYLQC